MVEGVSAAGKSSWATSHGLAGLVDEADPLDPALIEAAGESVEAHRAAFATSSLGIADAVVFLDPPEEEVRQRQRHHAVNTGARAIPENISAALNDVPFRGGPPTSLWLRTPIQLVFVAAVWWSAVRENA